MMYSFIRTHHISHSSARSTKQLMQLEGTILLHFSFAFEQDHVRCVYVCVCVHVKKNTSLCVCVCV